MGLVQAGAAKVEVRGKPLRLAAGDCRQTIRRGSVFGLVLDPLRHAEGNSIFPLISLTDRCQ